MPKVGTRISLILEKKKKEKKPQIGCEPGAKNTAIRVRLDVSLQTEVTEMAETESQKTLKTLLTFFLSRFHFPTYKRIQNLRNSLIKLNFPKNVLKTKAALTKREKVSPHFIQFIEQQYQENKNLSLKKPYGIGKGTENVEEKSKI